MQSCLPLLTSQSKKRKKSLQHHCKKKTSEQSQSLRLTLETNVSLSMFQAVAHKVTLTTFLTKTLKMIITSSPIRTQARMQTHLLQVLVSVLVLESCLSRQHKRLIHLSLTQNQRKIELSVKDLNKHSYNPFKHKHSKVLFPLLMWLLLWQWSHLIRRRWLKP